MSDEARAVAEVAKTTGEIVKAAGGVGSYLARVFASIPDNLLGLMVGDWLDHKRRRHLAELEANTARILEGIAADRLTEPSPSILIPLLQAAVDEGRRELQALWAAQLANAMVDGGKRVRRDYFEAVRQMEPVDVLVFQFVDDLVSANPAVTPSDILNQTLTKANQAGLSQNDTQISLEALTGLKCILRNQFGQPIVTSFGRGLLAACKAPE
jgi:hypothetical protein